MAGVRVTTAELIGLLAGYPPDSEVILLTMDDTRNVPDVYDLRAINSRDDRTPGDWDEVVHDLGEYLGADLAEEGVTAIIVVRGVSD